MNLLIQHNICSKGQFVPEVLYLVKMYDFFLVTDVCTWFISNNIPVSFWHEKVQHAHGTESQTFADN